MATKYTILPTAAGDFAQLDLMARAVFGLIWDRWQLSCKTQEETGKFSTTREMTVSELYPSRKYDRSKITVAEVYCVISQAELVRETGLCERTVRKSIRALEVAGVLRTERAGIRGANRYFCNWRLVDYFNGRTGDRP